MVTIWTLLLIIGLTVAGLGIIVYVLGTIFGVFRDPKGIIEVICAILLLVLVVFVVVGFIAKVTS